MDLKSMMVKQDELDAQKKAVEPPDQPPAVKPTEDLRIPRGTHSCRYQQLIMSDGTKVQASPLGEFDAKLSKELAEFLAVLVVRGEAEILKRL